MDRSIDHSDECLPSQLLGLNVKDDDWASCSLHAGSLAANAADDWPEIIKAKPPPLIETAAFAVPRFDDIAQYDDSDMWLKCEKPTKHVAIDCEMVGTGFRGYKSMLARVSIVTAFGHVLLDRYVAPTEPVTNYRTRVSGITAELLAGAPSFDQVQSEVCKLLGGRVLVGHALGNDFKVLKITHPSRDTRDTSRYFDDGGRRPKLQHLVEQYLGMSIQKGAHDSVEDARATMQLYIAFHDQWEKKFNLEV